MGYNFTAQNQTNLPNKTLHMLSACKQYGNAKMAIRFTDHLLSLKPKQPSTYILLSNIYDGSGVWEHASKARHLLEADEKRGYVPDTSCCLGAS
ncbi:hypothetical protein V6N13_054791 [Hibiscus sabdariffa]|uniref:Pentatricopeptide repeat-containing protein n=1 Tax=Hibiscus sabdariffa TaxID=183260 RepID=A0ABR2DWQ0_9ROSI